MKMDYDVVVIGAGPAGSVAAARLLADGLNVLVLEKMTFPRFVIGESLLPHCMDFLDKLDLLPCLEKQEFQVKNGVAFYHEEKHFQFHFNNQFTKNSWEYTWQVKRADFDKALIDEVEKRGAEVLYEAEVVAANFSSNSQEVTFKHPSFEGEKTVRAKFVLDASGYGRVLPRLLGLERPAPAIPRGAIFSHVVENDRSNKAGDNIFIHAFRNNTAWFWSIPFSDSSCSVGIVADKAFIEECAVDNGKMYKEYIKEFPGLAGRFQNSSLCFEPKVILNYAVSVEKMYGEGFALCGNATEFLDPVFSSGVTLAISSGYRAADLTCRTLKGENPNWEIEYSDVMKAGIDVFRTYVNAWYSGELGKIFFAKNPNPEFMKQICSVLGGYVWDLENPFVSKHNKLVESLAKIVDLYDIEKENILAK